MSRIAVIIDRGFEDSEYTQPADAFQQAGHELVHIGLKAGSTVSGKKAGTQVAIDAAAADARPEDYDALLIPGGYSPDHLRADESAVSFVGDFMDTGKPVFSICHGPQILITADKLRGRTVTGYKSIIQDIKNAGADFVDQEVVADGSLITSRNPNDLPAFIEKSLETLGKGRP
jgi:protease I